LDVLSGEVQFGWSRVEPNAVALKELAWSLTGSIGNSCTPFGSLGSYTDPLIGMEMVYVEGGEFTMGCLATREDFDDCDDAEKPANSVTVSSFWIGKYEVTQGQWEAVMGNTIQEQRDNLGSASHYPLHGVGAHTPMYYVSWNEAKAFCDTLSARTGWSYRLATEKEWEYAARGGNRSRGYVYSGSNTVDSVAWYYFNSGTNRDNNNPHAHAVGTTTKRGNELGIYDMSGNVWEWCSSGWRANYSYNDASEDDSYRVLRGGCWNDGKLNSRVAYRLHYAPGTYSYTFGFRVV
jgi:formylglycine-generating enzyme required for sulfatase activity